MSQKIGLDQPIDEATIRQIGLAQMRRWIGDPSWESVSAWRVGRCWIVLLTSPRPLDEDEILEPFTLSLGPDGAILGASKYNLFSVEDALRSTCLRALATAPGGKWTDIAPFLRYILPALSPEPVGGEPPFGKVVLKMWGALGETYAVDGAGHALRDGKPAGVLAKPILIPAFTIPFKKIPPPDVARTAPPKKRSPRV
ncbi:hypothetical protein BH11ARM2_BH11ARM2_10910 [soil metagenome]